ncbi:unnamed protein product [Alopecurus aequalis]
MKLSMQSLARKLSIPSPKRGKKDSGSGISRSEAPSFASSTSTSSSEEGGGALARSSTAPSPRSVLLQPAEISRRELEAVLRRLGHADLSADDLDEVAKIAAAAEDASGGDQDELMEAFRVFDADGDGRIDAEELRGVMAAILADGCSLDDCRRMIGGVDADGDGFVGFQDFARMMMMTTATTSTAATNGPRF